MTMPIPDSAVSSMDREQMLLQCSHTVIALIQARDALALLTPRGSDYEKNETLWAAQREHKRRDAVIRDLIVSIRDQQDGIVESERVEDE